MTTAVQTSHFNPLQQLSAFGEALAPIFVSLFERTSSAFRRVEVMKRDEMGNIKLYDSRKKSDDPTTGRSSLQNKKIAVLSYIEDIKTGDLYLDELDYVVAFKCALIALAMPLYTVGKIGWEAVRTPFEIGTIALDTLHQIGQQMLLGRLYESALLARDGLSQVSETLGSGLFEIVKAPLFLLGAELAAIQGIFKPYHGRKFEAMIEKAWQNGISYKEDFRKIPVREGEDCWQAFKTDILNLRTFYLAHCFQVRGNVSDARISVIRRTPL